MLLGHSALPVREAGVSGSAFPLQSEEAGIRYRLLKRLLKEKEAGRHHRFAGWGQVKGSANS